MKKTTLLYSICLLLTYTLGSCGSDTAETTSDTTPTAPIGIKGITDLQQLRLNGPVASMTSKDYGSADFFIQDWTIGKPIMVETTEFNAKGNRASSHIDIYLKNGTVLEASTNTTYYYDEQGAFSHTTMESSKGIRLNQYVKWDAESRQVYTYREDSDTSDISKAIEIETLTFKDDGSISTKASQNDTTAVIFYRMSYTGDTTQIHVKGYGGKRADGDVQKVVLKKDDYGNPLIVVTAIAPFNGITALNYEEFEYTYRE